MADSSIEWTEATWNPTTGCDKVSPGCGLPRFEGDATGGCYALALAKRLKAMGSPKYQTDGHPVTSGPGFGVAVHPGALGEPLRRRTPTMWFVNSMSDLFHARIPREFIAQVWETMAATPQHTYQVLTKRPERAARILGDPCVSCVGWNHTMLGHRLGASTKLPLPNVWLGTSVELSKYLHRVDDLRETPAAVRFISAEPLLGPLDGINLDGIDWLIAGGESGPGARPMDLDWVRDLIAACRQSGTAPFVKQLGAVWEASTGRRGKGNHIDAWPADLRVREYPPMAVPA